MEGRQYRDNYLALSANVCKYALTHWWSNSMSALVTTTNYFIAVVKTSSLVPNTHNYIVSSNPFGPPNVVIHRS